MFSQYRKLLSIHPLCPESPYSIVTSCNLLSLPVILSSIAAQPALGGAERPLINRALPDALGKLFVRKLRLTLPTQANFIARRACPFFYKNAIQLVRFSASHGSRVIPGAGWDSQSSGSVERLKVNRVVGARAVRI